jgi:hypothetical protein
MVFGGLNMPHVNWDLLNRAWAVLVETARARSTITYGELARRIMLPGDVRGMGPMLLHPLYVHFCAPNAFPDILSLVVRKDTGRPGIGFYGANGGVEDVALWRAELRETHDFDWPLDPPDPDAARKAGSPSGVGGSHGR